MTAEPIKNIEKYVELLKMGFVDKLFFIDKLFDKWKTMLDYGCSDGFQTKILAELFPDQTVFGYEPNLDLVNIAKNSGTLPGNIMFLRNTPKTPLDVLVLSSVIHEIYAYKSKEEIEEFWAYVFENGFKTIVIRDMIYDNTQESNFYLQINKVADVILEWSRFHAHFGQLTRFEAIYGPLATQRNVIQFLLKYLYIDSPNWDREINEDYLKLSLREFLKFIPKKYEIEYKEVYTLPFLRHRWREDFDLDFTPNTHIKIILRAK